MVPTLGEKNLPKRSMGLAEKMNLPQLVVFVGRKSSMFLLVDFGVRNKWLEVDVCLEVEVWLEVQVRLAPISFEGLDCFILFQCGRNNHVT